MIILYSTPLSSYSVNVKIAPWRPATEAWIAAQLDAGQGGSPT